MAPLSTSIAALVLLAAMLHATWNALAKSGGDRLLSLTGIMLVGSLCAALALPFVALPEAAAWPYLAASMALHTVYHFFLLRMYHYGDLSLTYPIARGTSPLLVGGLSAAFAGEILAPYQVVGLTLACASIASLARKRGRGPGDERDAILAALCTGVLIGLYTFVDGQGVRRAGAAQRYIVWSFFLDGLPLFAAALWLRGGGALWRYARGSYGRRSLVGGILGIFGYSIVLWALDHGAMAQVSALRETGVIFAALIGTHLLGESFGRARVAAACGVAVGVALLNA